MPLIMPCKVCGRPFEYGDLYHVQMTTPDYDELPEDAELVDPRGDGEEPVIRVQYCEMCLEETRLPPLEAVSDPDLAPDPHLP